MSRRFIAEWEKQKGVILAFAHEQTDWSYCLEEVRACVVRIATEICKHEEVYLLCRDSAEAKTYFESHENIYFIECDFNDTWMRDCSVLCVEEDNDVVFVGFSFNAWGGKFEYSLDNHLKKVLQARVYDSFESHDYILEGGAVESDGNGSIMTSSSCLLNANRNPRASKENVSSFLEKSLGSEQVLWLDDGQLRGDDTDGHIDTLARFCDKETIVYVGLPEKSDEHYMSMLKMKQQLEAFKNIKGESYTLVALPFVEALYDEGERLPATYANFLIINGAVLMPTYGLKSDKEALDILKKVFKDREVIGIDCRVLIREHGSLHCMCMQIAQSKI